MSWRRLGTTNSYNSVQNSGNKLPWIWKPRGQLHHDTLHHKFDKLPRTGICDSYLSFNIVCVDIFSVSRQWDIDSSCHNNLLNKGHQLPKCRINKMSHNG